MSIVEVAFGDWPLPPAERVARAVEDFAMTCRELSPAPDEVLAEQVAFVDVRGLDGTVHTVPLSLIDVQGLFAALHQGGVTMQLAAERSAVRKEAA